MTREHHTTIQTDNQCIQGLGHSMGFLEGMDNFLDNIFDGLQG
jgi:hypothetical protein